MKDQNRSRAKIISRHPSPKNQNSPAPHPSPWERHTEGGRKDGGGRGDSCYVTLSTMMRVEERERRKR